MPVFILPRVGVDSSFTSTSDDLRLRATVQHLVQIQVRPYFQLSLRVYLLGPPKIVWKVVDWWLQGIFVRTNLVHNEILGTYAMLALPGSMKVLDGGCSESVRD